MSNSLQDWLRFGWLKEHKTSPEEIASLLAVADRDLTACEDASRIADDRLANGELPTAAGAALCDVPGDFAPPPIIDMRCTCFHTQNMSRMIQIRDVPDSVHSLLKARAAREGISLSDFIKRELERVAERPSLQEWLDLTRQAKPIPTKRSPAQIVRNLRDHAPR